MDSKWLPLATDPILGQAPSNTPLTVSEIEALLEGPLEVEFSFRDTRPPSQSIAGLSRGEQEFLLDWIIRVASTHVELGYQIACHGVAALAAMDHHMIEAWALHTMDVYDLSGLRPALQVIDKSAGFAEMQHTRLHGAILEEEERVLTGFLHGLSGRKLKIAASDSTYTDTETLFLPSIQSLFSTREENFLHYKITLALLWAQIRFGTFRALRDIGPTAEGFVPLFHGMETLRLEGCLSRELPGLYRQMVHLKDESDVAVLSSEWQLLSQQLSRPGVSVWEVADMAQENLGKLAPCTVSCFQGGLAVESAIACMETRAEREKAHFKVRLQQILDEQAKKQTGEEERDEEKKERFMKKEVEDPSYPEGFRVEILLDDLPVPLPDEMAALASSIIVDFGDIPNDYLEPAGPGEYDPSLLNDDDEEQEDVWSGTYHEEGAFLYQEWDFQRKHYRKNWCAVREKEVVPIHDNFVADTLERYSGLVRHLRKTFEAMRDEDRLLKRQPHGDGVDIDALVEALADVRQGREMTDRLFTRMHRSERNIAVVFMVDMSGSTKGWINQAERESLVLLCEALETLGDRYAIYGFSSMTRKRCELFHIKHFSEAYDDETRARINGILPQDYTRMGFAIRHLSSLLQETEAKTRMLITLSDGKPDDYDSYRGQYGIEDTRRALVEARQSGIHPYCITIDDEARDYLPHLYGPAAFTVVDDVKSLPLKVSDIYRRLTRA
ncbi:MAG: nitric oxide reductase activation protein [Candidatus Sedimenticola sp. (ex Thyasira tokunagai)]